MLELAEGLSLENNEGYLYMIDKNKDLPAMRLIIKMSVPAMISMLITALYNIVDSIFVSRLGDNALTAVSLAMPIQILIIAFGVGTGVGLSALISRKLGEKDYEYVDQTANYAIPIGLIIGIFFAVFGFFFNQAFFEMFTDDPLIIEGGLEYTNLITLFAFTVTVQLLVEKAIQATGNMLAPMVIVLAGAITNIILDPLLIFGLLGFPALGIRGAAIATVIGQAISLVFGIIYFYRAKIGLKVGAPDFLFKKKIINDIMAVGLPAILMQALSSFLVFILNNIVSVHSIVAVSVLGIYFKLQQFVFMPVFGVAQGIRPIEAYFYGAEKKDKLDEIFKKSKLLTSLVMLSGTAIFVIFAPSIVNIFNPSQEMYRLGVEALRLISISFFFAGLNIMYATLFQSTRDGKTSFIVSFLREFIIILPLSVILGKFMGLTGVWLSFVISEALTFLITRTFLVKKANISKMTMKKKSLSGQLK